MEDEEYEYDDDDVWIFDEAEDEGVDEVQLQDDKLLADCVAGTLELKQKEEYNYALSFGVVDLNNIRKNFPSAACLAPWRNYFPKGLKAIYCNYRDKWDEPEVKRYLEFLTSPELSPWRRFLDFETEYNGVKIHSAEFIYDNGYIETRPDANTTVIATFMCALRDSYEHNSSVLFWDKLVQAGVDPHLAYAISRTYNLPKKSNSGNLNYHSNMTHTFTYPPHSLKALDAMAIRFRNAEYNVENNGMLSNSGNYSAGGGYGMYFTFGEETHQPYQYYIEDLAINRELKALLKTKQAETINHATFNPIAVTTDKLNFDNLVEYCKGRKTLG